VIAAGPTGSGKSSLLYAAVDHLNTPWRNIATIEDPIERTIPGVNQIELSPHTTFHELLPALLRQDPDVFLIGEMRNRETAETAFHAATTGHLALTSVHAANCIDTVLRLDHLLQNRTLLSSALRLIVSGRLLPLNCKQCLTPHTPSPELGRVFGISLDTTLSSSSGCEACHGFGHRGRIGAFEILTCGEELRRALLCNERLNRDELQQLATTRGYRPYAHEVRRLLLRGAISPQTALRALGIAPEFFHGERG
jgi:type II secretory ATPase GspE/PulE/Tfp pilus assembly ATPase PilB-like protein